jgi:hypothetical protein
MIFLLYIYYKIKIKKGKYMQLSKEEIAALDYFSSDETQKKYELLAVKDSSIVILEGNDTVFIKQNNTTDFIDSIKSELPRRKIKFS